MCKILRLITTRVNIILEVQNEQVSSLSAVPLSLAFIWPFLLGCVDVCVPKK